MKRTLSFLIPVLGWFAVITQYFITLENRVTSFPEANLRFFSFFTILTNSLVAIYFTWLLFGKNREAKTFNNPGALYAITVYITMVCIVYQFALRHLLQLTGINIILNELLHSVIPVLVIIFWYLYKPLQPDRYTQIATWGIYPLIYLTYILFRGHFSNFYPYPFVNVAELGLKKVLLNSVGIILLFLTVSFVFVFVGKSVVKK